MPFGTLLPGLELGEEGGEDIRNNRTSVNAPKGSEPFECIRVVFGADPVVDERNVIVR